MGGDNSSPGASPGPDQPRAYSTAQTYQVSGGSGSYGADGYDVVIAPDQLNAAVAHWQTELHGQTRVQLQRSLTSSTIDAEAFGSVPSATTAYAAVTQFISDHLDAMHKMGISVDEFVARVQAAAQIGTESDPVTKAAAARAEAMMKRMAF